ncbi:DUF3096 domain-containing protein [Geoalkalibacter sp.]
MRRPIESTLAVIAGVFILTIPRLPNEIVAT